MLGVFLYFGIVVFREIKNMVTSNGNQYASVREYYEWVFHLRRALTRATKNRDAFMTRHYLLVLADEVKSEPRIASCALHSAAFGKAG